MPFLPGVGRSPRRPTPIVADKSELRLKALYAGIRQWFGYIPQPPSLILLCLKDTSLCDDHSSNSPIFAVDFASAVINRHMLRCRHVSI